MAWKIRLVKGEVVYVLRCRDGSLYCGWTSDLDRRLALHSAGRASRYTSRRLPVELAATFTVPADSTPRKLEWRIKQLTRAQKLELIAGVLPLADVAAGRSCDARVCLQRHEGNSRP